LFLNVFLTSKAFFELFLLVSSVNLFKVYCKKKKKSEIFFLFTKNGGVMRSVLTAVAILTAPAVQNGIRPL
jgi:hypothetical protein